jgi:hypothetical protein
MSLFPTQEAKHVLCLALAIGKHYQHGMAKKPRTKKRRTDGAVLFVRFTKKEKDFLVTISEAEGFRNLSEWLRVKKLKEELQRANA